jgi:5-methyltetrahydrofolate--homocysteine methyltransferase
MSHPEQRRKELLGAFQERILVLDGAMGTMLQQARLGPQDFGGARYEGCNEHLTRTRPDVVLGVHRAYYEAGADIVETNTFGGTRIVLEEYGLADQAAELNRAAARLARQAAEEFSTPSKPRWVAGAMGPTTKAISVTGGVTFAQLREAYLRAGSGA